MRRGREQEARVEGGVEEEGGAIGPASGGDEGK